MKSYNFTEKDSYRRRLWSEVDKCISKPKALRTVVYLDTSEALESKHLIDIGYSPENLLAVNRSAAEAAWISMRLKTDGYPQVQTAGLEWERAIGERCAGVDVVNFDGMGCLTVALVDLMAMTVIWARPKVLAVNMLGGRERGDEFGSVIRMFSSNEDDVVTSFGRITRATHRARVRSILGALIEAAPGDCWIHATRVSWDVYTSACGQPMVWFVSKLDPHLDLGGFRVGQRDMLERYKHAKKKRRRLFGAAANVGVYPSCVQPDDYFSIRQLAAFMRAADAKALATAESCFKVALENRASVDEARRFTEHYFDTTKEERRIEQDRWCRSFVYTDARRKLQSCHEP